MTIRAAITFRIMTRILAWVGMHAGVVLALRLSEAQLDDSPFHTLGLFGKLSNGGLLLAGMAFFVSCLSSVCAVIVYVITIRSVKAKWAPVRPHMLLWSRLVLLVALGCHLAGEVGDSQHSACVGNWHRASIKALMLAVCFALLLVLDVLIDWTHTATVASRSITDQGS